MATLCYNIRLQLGDKTLIGVTQDDLSVSAITKESITKDDNGVKQKAITGHDVTFKVAGIIDMTGGSSSVLDNDDLIDMAQETGSSAELDLTYLRSDGAAYEGVAVITGYSESSPADPDSDATYSLDLKGIGDLAIVSQSNG